MMHPTKVALAAAAAGIMLLGGAGTFATSVGQQEWSDLIVALGLIGYVAALLVAAFGRRRPRYVRD
jgi:alternate signal-mediated exported protein